ncbi:MAG: ABC transporter permease [Gemmatimonadota bacterium]|nr:MAG: ABC transporter permease [Gemmatimonadota bacterium]
MKIPIAYNVRSLRERPVSTLTTAAGMALVVAVFVAMMALANGFRSALVRSGSSDNALVLRKGANTEMYSGIGRETASIIAGMPFVARGSDNQPLSSPEVFVVIGADRLTGGMANLVVRGVSPKAMQVRQGIEIIAGRELRPGASEVLVGEKIVDRFANTGLGETFSFGGRDWIVAGHFSANGSAFESEIWAENEQVMPVFRGEVFQSVTFRMTDPASFEGVKQQLEDDPRLYLDAFRENEYYENQSVILTFILNFIAIFIAGVMAIGAVFGAINTMYAAVSSRAPEIAVLLTLGFKPGNVLSSFLIEAVFIALIGGIMGCILTLPINGLVTSTTNWNSFSEVAFAFRVTPALLLSGMAFAAIMGFLGGFFPALKAARQPVIVALRQG